MKPLVLKLRMKPDQRLDLSPLVPQRLPGRTVAEITPVSDKPMPPPA